jgi:hypothetical protein
MSKTFLCVIDGAWLWMEFVCLVDVLSRVATHGLSAVIASASELPTFMRIPKTQSFLYP